MCLCVRFFSRCKGIKKSSLPLAGDYEPRSLVAAISSTVVDATVVVAGRICGAMVVAIARTSVTVNSINIPLGEHNFTFLCFVTITWDNRGF